MKKLVNFTPSRPWAWLLGVIPLVLVIGLYIWGSNARLAENPNDKLLPSFSQMGNAMERMALQPSKRSGEYLFWTDTAASLRRLGLGIAIAAVVGLAFGLLTGAFPVVNASVSPLLTVISLIPPLALLPILFIVLGLDELSKVVLIVIGVAPFIARDLQKHTLELPREMLVKAQTLGANSLQILLRVLLPQIMPRLIDAVRLSLGTGWLFLIAAEAIAATDGLGYRIFLVRRYLAMDVIIPYVFWITLLAFMLDVALAWFSRVLYPWHHRSDKS